MGWSFDCCPPPLVEVVDEVNDQVGGAALESEVVMLLVEHVAVETEAEFHEMHLEGSDRDTVRSRPS